MAKAKKTKSKKKTEKKTTCKVVGYAVYYPEDENLGSDVYDSIVEVEKDWGLQDSYNEGQEVAIVELRQVRYRANTMYTDKPLNWDESCS